MQSESDSVNACFLCCRREARKRCSCCPGLLAARILGVSRGHCFPLNKAKSGWCLTDTDQPEPLTHDELGGGSEQLCPSLVHASGVRFVLATVWMMISSSDESFESVLESRIGSSILFHPHRRTRARSVETASSGDMGSFSTRRTIPKSIQDVVWKNTSYPCGV
jgi:hypothetical protein